MFSQLYGWVFILHIIYRYQEAVINVWCIEIAFERVLAIYYLNSDLAFGTSLVLAFYFIFAAFQMQNFKRFLNAKISWTLKSCTIL